MNETDGYLTVGVEIQEGSLELEQSVLISTQAGTATPGMCMSRMNYYASNCGMYIKARAACCTHGQGICMGIG